MTEIVQDCIWLGSKEDAENVDFLLRNKITHVINVCGRMARPMFRSRFQKQRVSHIVYYEIEADDHPLYPILDKHGNEISNLMNSIIAENLSHRILIHCYAGMNRSATLLIHFLKEKAFPYQSVHTLIDHVRKLRPIILSNRGFESQLRHKHN